MRPFFYLDELNFIFRFDKCVWPLKRLPLNNEKILISQLKKGDHQAFNALFEYYGKKLYYFSLRYFNETADAEEIVQEVFLKVWEKKANIKKDCSFNAFLIKISKNLIYNKLRQKINSQKYQYHLAHQNNFSENTTENDNNFKSLNGLINESIQAMPPQRQEVFRLSREKGQNNGEIARTLNISLSTVENHINKALKTVREFIKVP